MSASPSTRSSPVTISSRRRCARGAAGSSCSDPSGAAAEGVSRAISRPPIPAEGHRRVLCRRGTSAPIGGAAGTSGPGMKPPRLSKHPAHDRGGGVGAEAGLLEHGGDDVLRRADRAEADEERGVGPCRRPGRCRSCPRSGTARAGSPRTPAHAVPFGELDHADEARRGSGRGRRPAASTVRRTPGSDLALDAGRRILSPVGRQDPHDDVRLVHRAAVGEGGVHVRQLQRGDEHRRPDRWRC